MHSQFVEKDGRFYPGGRRHLSSVHMLLSVRLNFQYSLCPAESATKHARATKRILASEHLIISSTDRNPITTTEPLGKRVSPTLLPKFSEAGNGLLLRMHTQVVLLSSVAYARRRSFDNGKVDDKKDNSKKGELCSDSDKKMLSEKGGERPGERRDEKPGLPDGTKEA